MIHGGDIYSNEIEYDFSVNLNPLSCPPDLMEAMRASLEKVSVYPDIEQREFRKAIAGLEGLSAENVLGGNGASELIMSIIRKEEPKRALILSPGFYGYTYGLEALPECEILRYYLCSSKDFLLTEEIFDYLKESRPDLILLANPNNPTGRNIEEKTLFMLADFCDREGISLLLDECFLMMSDLHFSFASRVEEYEKLYVVTAFTKLFAIPGVRVGYALSNRRNIKELKKYLPEWNLSILASEAGISCAKILQETDFLERTRAEISRERVYLYENLLKLTDKVYESETSFILIYSNLDLYELLLKEKVLIRDCSNFDGLKKGYYRIAVKDHKSNEELIRRLGKVVNNGD